MKKAIFIILPLFIVICAATIIFSKVSNTPPPLLGKITLTRTRGYLDLYNLSTKTFKGFDFDDSARFLHNSPYVFQDGQLIERYNTSTNESVTVYPVKETSDGRMLSAEDIIPIDEDNFLFVRDHKLMKYSIKEDKEELILDPPESSVQYWIDNNYDYNSKSETIYYRGENYEILAYDMSKKSTKELGLSGSLPRVSDDNRFLVYRYGSVNKKSLTVYDQVTGESWTRPAKDYIEDFCFSPDGEYVAVLEPDRSLTNFSVGHTRQISVWDYKNNKSYVVYKHVYYANFRLDWIA